MTPIFKVICTFFRKDEYASKTEDLVDKEV
jgi:hypothetical protein